MGPCKRRIRIDPALHKRNRAFVSQMREYGGDAVLEAQSGIVRAGKHVNRGAYSRVKFPRGVVDFHSHPSKCLNKNTCAVGLPSPADCCNVIKGAAKGTLFHMVLSREGTYVLRLNDHLLEQLRLGQVTTQQLCDKCIPAFTRLHDEYAKRSVREYPKYRSRWLRLARKLGFIAQLFQKNRRPSVTLACTRSSATSTFAQSRTRKSCCTKKRRYRRSRRRRRSRSRSRSVRRRH